MFTKAVGFERQRICPVFQVIVILVIARQDRGAARLHTFKNFRLGIGNAVHAVVEIPHMHCRDRGNDRDMGAHEPRQRRDFPRHRW